VKAREVILVSHGSRRGEFNALMESLARRLQEDLGVPVRVGYNEYSEPNWRDLMRGGDGPVVIALAFLGSGNHVRRDILGELGVEAGRWQMSRFGRLVYVTQPLGESPLIYQALKARVQAALGGSAPAALEDPEEIEAESLNAVARALGLNMSDWRDRLRARAAYASGSLEVARALRVADDLLEAFKEWLGGPVVADTHMVAAGLRYRRDLIHVALDCADAARGSTRSRAGMLCALRRRGAAGVVVGNAPTALLAVLEFCLEGGELPYVIAAPVGFVNAARAKEEFLKKCRVPSAVVAGTYGGSGVAAAIFNELVRIIHGG
jgi:precorrin-8X/cobalt-precorrin-8 methylmutase